MVGFGHRAMDVPVKKRQAIEEIVEIIK